MQKGKQIIIFWEIMVTGFMESWTVFRDFGILHSPIHFCSLTVGRNFPRENEIEAVFLAAF